MPEPLRQGGPVPQPGCSLAVPEQGEQDQRNTKQRPGLGNSHMMAKQFHSDKAGPRLSLQITPSRQGSARLGIVIAVVLCRDGTRLRVADPFGVFKTLTTKE